MRLDNQEPQLGAARAFLHHEYRADRLAVHLGDPAALALRVEVLDEFGGDLGDQRLEAHAPAVFLLVDRAVRPDHPAHVTGPVWAQLELAFRRAWLEHRMR